MTSFLRASFLVLGLTTFISNAAAADGRWTPERARIWYETKPWLVGSNYIPSTASNQLEMWQPETFDPVSIDRELGWAESLGFNTARIFLHDLAFERDPSGFFARVDQVLGIAEKHRIQVMFVLFDSCWDPAPHVGAQEEPRAGVHNSRWVQSPGVAALRLAQDPESATSRRLRRYVRSVVQRFASDPRVLAWDVWNEANNANVGSYNDDPSEKIRLVQNLLPKVFSWARSAAPTQPLTSSIWDGEWSPERLTEIQQIALGNSDIVNFHNYGNLDDFQKRINILKLLGRPMICTEYMARPFGSTFQNILPVADKERIGMMNWGLVQGRSQTYIPWESWEHPYAEPVKLWFHDVFLSDGTPYSLVERDYLQKLLLNR